MPRPGPTSPPAISKSSTFAEFAGWLDYYDASLGPQFLDWVPAHSTTPDVQVQLNSATYGKPPNNSAYSWFSVWFAQGVIAPELGGTLAKGIGGISNKIPGALQGAGEGIGQVPGAQALSGIPAIGDFFNRLGEASTWIRVAEVLLGLGLIIVGLAKLASGTPVGKAAAKVGETAAIL